jgi:hypothetical protein
LLLIRTALLLACALCLLAQTEDTPPPTPPPTGDTYGGPAILSRGQVPTAASSAPVAFRPYIGLSGIYDSGLLPVSVNSSGQIPTPGLYGVELQLGLYGYHTWKHTTLALDYRGDFRHYSQQTYYDGSDHILSLILTHQTSRRLMFTVREQVGTYSENFFMMSLGYLYPGYSQLPQNDIYDNRVILVGGSGDMIYRMTARLSFDLGADGDLIRRRSSALYGVTTASAHGDLQYRASRHTTLGADYRYTHFDFTRGFGNANIHSVGFNYSALWTRRLQFSARIGAARVETLSLTQVALDPAIAALIGQSYGIQAAHRLNYAPDISARLTDSFRRSQLYLSYSNGITPGNGVYLTSRMQTGGAGYHYTGIRHWNFGVDGTYSHMSTLMQTLGAFTSYGGGVGVTRDLGKGLHAVLRVNALHYAVAANYFLHNEFRTSLGLTFSPGDVPLALW